MNSEASTLISRHRDAKRALGNLFSGTDYLDDAMVKRLDSELRKSFEQLLIAHLIAKDDLILRMNYLVTQLQEECESGGMMDQMVSVIKNDLVNLDDKKETPSLEENSIPQHANINSLIELCYSSKATHVFSDQQLVDLLTQAKARNLHAGITGVLIYDEASNAFHQILEGPESEIRCLVSRLLADDRHENLTIRLSGKIEKRMYKDWSLRLAKTSGSHGSTHCKDVLAQELQELSRKPDRSIGHDWLMDSIGERLNSNSIVSLNE